MDSLAEKEGLRIDLAYAQKDNLLFGQPIYRPNARLFLHKSLAKIVETAAQICHAQHNLRMVLYDGLRTTEAQTLMLETDQVKQNPHWLEEPRLLSPPGAGAHPRAMAIDLSLETENGKLLDMGTPFDFLAEDPSPEKNPAHRNHPHHTPKIMKNRKILDDVMTQAADEHHIPLLLLPQEWWDFRLPPEIYEAYAPLSDKNLPTDMRMTKTD